MGVRQTDRQTDRHTDRQTDRQRDRERDTHTYVYKVPVLVCINEFIKG